MNRSAVIILLIAVVASVSSLYLDLNSELQDAAQEPEDSLRLEKRIHSLSLLRMGKLFRGADQPSQQVKRYDGRPRLWILRRFDGYTE
ncbi:hypothetical protein AAVH_07032 [Aphelenchoides avenae]|nr:hypothetical protein AAVH_07032 [Aphelenchus avenae]